MLCEHNTLNQGEEFGGPAPLPAGAPVSEFITNVTLLLDIMVSRGYALKVRKCCVWVACAQFQSSMFFGLLGLLEDNIWSDQLNPLTDTDLSVLGWKTSLLGSRCL